MAIDNRGSKPRSKKAKNKERGSKKTSDELVRRTATSLAEVGVMRRAAISRAAW